ncbi:DUF3240 family protein [Thermomonas hydrothermalis]|uniref:DUF3240 domain-containing protein n=1 Tax=Thermomonas hydrothermalis TaxID=213588 RepID=A0A1M4TMU4_9GAMM|nr:DUF3240 family protein [Thermomonas hydrothermalis]SHE45803.1 Protein of unknown function [Thermomonas hydrothermalis]
MTALVRLTLVFPPSLEDPITDALSAHPGLPGFTLLSAEGHTRDFLRASVAEQVRGRVQRRVLWILLEPAQLDMVLDTVRTVIATDDVRWWTEAVLESGRLA